jgi:hypothetical protein
VFYKHSSLFGPIINDEEIKFYNFEGKTNTLAYFALLPMMRKLSLVAWTVEQHSSLYCLTVNDKETFHYIDGKANTLAYLTLTSNKFQSIDGSANTLAYFAL